MKGVKILDIPLAHVFVGNYGEQPNEKWKKVTGRKGSAQMVF